MKITRQEAFDILARCRIMHGVDLGSLSKTQIEALLAEADRLNYPRTKARARNFHAYVCRVIEETAR